MAEASLPSTEPHYAPVFDTGPHPIRCDRSTAASASTSSPRRRAPV
ncbi:MAG: hypothetical protein U0Q47_06685 [Mycobacterium sp.]